jgi:nucleotide-binding universal stress UspA family protein
LLEIEGREARDYLDALKRRLPDVTSVEVRRGDVARELAGAATGIGADLIMMSTHGRAGIESYWAGSIAARILARYSQPLLLMRIRQNGVVNPDSDLEGRETRV